MLHSPPSRNSAVRRSLPRDPRKISNLFVISDSWNREPLKNSWRSLDRGGNGYLGVYEGGARRAGGIHQSQVRTKGHPREEGKGADSAETARKAPEEDAMVPPPLRPFAKGAVGRSEAAALSKNLLLLSLSLSV